MLIISPNPYAESQGRYYYSILQICKWSWDRLTTFTKGHAYNQWYSPELELSVFCSKSILLLNVNTVNLPLPTLLLFGVGWTTGARYSAASTCHSSHPTGNPDFAVRCKSEARREEELTWSMEQVLQSCPNPLKGTDLTIPRDKWHNQECASVYFTCKKWDHFCTWRDISHHLAQGASCQHPWGLWIAKCNSNYGSISSSQIFSQERESESREGVCVRIILAPEKGPWLIVTWSLYHRTLLSSEGHWVHLCIFTDEKS